MKKVLIGCLVVLVLCAIGGGVAVFFLYRAAAPMIQSFTESIDRAKEITALGEKITNKTPYTAPDNGELTEAQIDRFMRVQDKVVTTLGPRWTQLEAKVKDIQSRNEAGKNEPSFTEVLNFFAEAGSVLVEARRAQVDALNVEQFSQEEYNWVRVSAYSAAGLELAGAIDWSEIQKMLEQNAAQTGGEVPAMPKIEVPEANRALVKPHVAKLKEWWGLAFLGL
jgi:hypothetical protein